MAEVKSGSEEEGFLGLLFADRFYGLPGIGFTGPNDWGNQ